MGGNKDLIRKTARLARLHLTEEEIEKYSEELVEVLEAFSKLQELGTSGVERSLHPYKISAKLREDVPGKPSGRDALKLTKHKKDGYYKSSKLQ